MHKKHGGDVFVINGRIDCAHRNTDPPSSLPMRKRGISTSKVASSTKIPTVQTSSELHISRYAFK